MNTTINFLKDIDAHILSFIISVKAYFLSFVHNMDVDILCEFIAAFAPVTVLITIIICAVVLHKKSKKVGVYTLINQLKKQLKE